MAIKFIDKLKPLFSGKLIDEVDVDFPNITTSGKLPYWDGTNFKESPLSFDESEDEVVSTIAIRAPAGTIYIGKQLGIDDAGGNLIYTTLKDDITRICLTVGVDDTGTVQHPFTTFFEPKETRFVVQSDDTSEVVSNTFTITITGTADEFISNFYGKIGTIVPVNDVNFKIYFDSITDNNLIVDETVKASSFTANTEFSKPLIPVVGQFLNQQTITVITSITPFALKSDTLNNPWMAVDRQVGEISTLVNEAPEDGKQYVRKDGAWFEIPDFALKNNVLELDNTTPFTPDADYEPATKKYVDKKALNVYYNESLSISSNDEDNFENKVTLNLPSTFVAGDYFIEVYYGWRHNSNYTDFEARVQLDTTNIGTKTHRQEPQDSGSDQAFCTFRRFKKTMTSGVHTIELDYRSANDNNYSYIWDASITVTKINIQT